MSGFILQGAIVSLLLSHFVATETTGLLTFIQVYANSNYLEWFLCQPADFNKENAFPMLPEKPRQYELAPLHQSKHETNTLCSNAPEAGKPFNKKGVIIDRGNCAFTEKVANAQNLGAEFVLIADNRNKSEFLQMGRGTNINLEIPACAITKSNGERLKELMLHYSVSVRVGATTGQILIQGESNLMQKKYEAGETYLLQWTAPIGWRVTFELIHETSESLSYTIGKGVLSSAGFDDMQAFAQERYDKTHNLGSINEYTFILPLMPSGLYYFRASLPGIEITTDESFYPIELIGLPTKAPTSSTSNSIAPSPFSSAPTSYADDQVFESSPYITLLGIDNAINEVYIGDTVLVTWDTGKFIGPAKIDLHMKDKDGPSFNFIETILDEVVQGTGEYSWTIPNSIVKDDIVEGTLRLVLISLQHLNETTSPAFAFSRPRMTNVKVHPHEDKNEFRITWITYGKIDEVEVLVSCLNGEDRKSTQPNSGVYVILLQNSAPTWCNITLQSKEGARASLTNVRFEYKHPQVSDPRFENFGLVVLLIVVIACILLIAVWAWYHRVNRAKVSCGNLKPDKRKSSIEPSSNDWYVCTHSIHIMKPLQKFHKYG